MWTPWRTYMCESIWKIDRTKFIIEICKLCQHRRIHLFKEFNQGGSRRMSSIREGILGQHQVKRSQHHQGCLRFVGI